MKTQNKYSFPVNKKDIIKVDKTSSPAHKGRLEHSVDFIVNNGIQVVAALKGTVIEVKDDSDVGGKSRRYEKHGNYIEIQHENGEYSEYEHLQRRSSRVKVGDRVKKGQIIALSGATGWLAHLGPHLHFMVGKYGKNVGDYQTLEIVWENRKKC